MLIRPMMMQAAAQSAIVTTWNQSDKTSNITLSSDLRTATITGAADRNSSIRAIGFKSAGKWAVTFKAGTGGGENAVRAVGFYPPGFSLTADPIATIAVFSNGLGIWIKGSKVSTESWSLGDEVRLEIDLDGLILTPFFNDVNKGNFSIAGITMPLAPSAYMFRESDFTTILPTTSPTSGYAGWS